jgi:hypothetical protein
VLGRNLDDPGILIEFFSIDNSKHFRVSVSPNGAAEVTVSLEDPGNGMYRIMLTPTNYQIIQFFLRITEGETVSRDPVIFPVNAAKVVGIDAPPLEGLPAPLQTFLGAAELDAFRNDAGGLMQGKALYDALPPLLKAALLNLYTKSTATVLGDGQPVFASLGAMIKLDQDRVFVKTGAGLLEETMQDTFFHLVDDSLHQTIPPYKIFTSYKTRDAHGNLQLTFSRNGDTGNDYLVDMDIDEAQGFQHIFEVLQNAITSSLTNPYEVREILVADQNLQPLYGFRFPATGTAGIALVAG